MEPTIKQMLLDVLSMWAYDRGHSYGVEEVDAIMQGYLHDVYPILVKLDELELK